MCWQLFDCRVVVRYVITSKNGELQDWSMISSHFWRHESVWPMWRFHLFCWSFAMPGTSTSKIHEKLIRSFFLVEWKARRTIPLQHTSVCVVLFITLKRICGFGCGFSHSVPWNVLFVRGSWKLEWGSVSCEPLGGTQQRPVHALYSCTSCAQNQVAVLARPIMWPGGDINASSTQRQGTLCYDVTRSGWSFHGLLW